MAGEVYDILVINPGATSTKIAVFRDEEAVLDEVVDHDVEDLREFETLMDQRPYRRKLILGALERAGISSSAFHAVVGRGGMLAPMPGGTYEVSVGMIEDLHAAKYGEHASNLGPLLAREFADMSGCRAYIVDAVSTDELEPIARLSGLPEIERASLFHALNHKAVARQAAAQLGRPYEELRLIVAHMGSGISVGAHIGGRVVDVFDPMNEGAFSADRAGTLPIRFLINLCYSGKYSHREMLKKINGDAGLSAYIGTKDLRKAWEMVRGGDAHAVLVLDAFAAQIAKDVGAMATVCRGRIDCIVFTGGMAHSPSLMELIRERVAFLAPIMVIPGEEEMQALALGALRVLRGEEPAKTYAE